MIPAAVVGILLERLVLGPALSRPAENFATLRLAAGVRQVLALLAGLAAAAMVAVAWVGHGASRESVIEGLASA